MSSQSLEARHVDSFQILLAKERVDAIQNLGREGRRELRVLKRSEVFTERDIELEAFLAVVVEEVLHEVALHERGEGLFLAHPGVVLAGHVDEHHEEGCQVH